MLRGVHVFESRDAAFRDAQVLQENVVLHVVKGVIPETVTITSSHGAAAEEASTRTAPYDEVVHPGDPQRFVRLVMDGVGAQLADRLRALPATLPDLSIQVSTGRVVAFRAREHLRPHADEGTAPLVAFENHMNVFHQQSRGLPASLTRGLATFLNSTPVDHFLRQFNGHTQVNATDLRSLRYPSAEELEVLGAAIDGEPPSQERIDELVRTHVSGFTDA